MRRYAAEQPDEYTKMIRSRSVETDALVVRMLDYTGLLHPTHRFEDNAIFLVRYVWTEAFGPGAPDSLIAALPSASQPLRNITVLLHRLRDARDDSLLSSIYHMKELYVSHHTQGNSNVCSVLTCMNVCPERGTLMNRMRYCPEHFGFALLHGLRHAPLVNGAFCEVCHVWSVLCLKTAMPDPGHRHNTMVRMFIPLHDRATGRANVRLRLHRPAYGPARLPTDGLLVQIRGSGRPTYVDSRGQRRLVPAGAWAYTGRNGIVRSWVHVEREDIRNGGWNPVASPSELWETERIVMAHGGPEFFPEGGGGGWTIDDGASGW